MMMSKRNVETYYQGRFKLTPEAITIAKAAIQNLWNERQEERGDPATSNRAGSCKFAALLARDLFGGRLAGSDDHVFVLQRDGSRLDLNESQPDVIELGERAHRLECHILSDIEYREALTSCTARVKRWVNWAEERLDGHPKPDPVLSTKARLEAVREALGAGEHKTSKKKVPYLLVGSNVSVAWFGTNQHYRVFEGFGAGAEQRRYDFAKPETVADFIKSMLGNQIPAPTTGDQHPTIEMTP